MEIILDANVLISALIKDSYTRRFILFSKHSFYTPEFIFGEIYEHINEIKEKIELSEFYIKEILDNIIVLGNIKVIPFDEFKEYGEEAKRISPDIDDIHYIALALKLKCAIWSNDKKLKNQEKVKVYSTQDIINLFKK